MEEEEEEDQNDADRFLSCEALKVPCVCGENARNRIFVCCLLFNQSLLSFFQDYFLLSMSIIQKDSFDIKKKICMKEPILRLQQKRHKKISPVDIKKS